MTTKTEWCDEIINPIQSTLKGPERKLKNGKTLPGLGYHCTKISLGCKNCYAEMMNQRFGNGEPYQFGAHSEFELIETELEKPARWKKPKRIFVQSMSDLFHEDVSGKLINKIWMVMYNNPQHIFQILTKRPNAILAWTKAAAWTKAWPIEDIWPQWIHLGVTVCTQAEADEKIPILLQIPAAVRFVSIEPMLEGIDLPIQVELRSLNLPMEPPPIKPEILSLGIDWVIVGGETGPRARPMHLEWVRSIRDQCQESETAFFFKGWGSWAPNHAYDYYPENKPLLCMKKNGEFSFIAGDIGDESLSNWSTNFESTDHPIEKRGKKDSGRLLDGREWNEFPKIGGGDCEL